MAIETIFYKMEIILSFLWLKGEAQKELLGDGELSSDISARELATQGTVLARSLTNIPPSSALCQASQRCPKYLVSTRGRAAALFPHSTLVPPKGKCGADWVSPANMKHTYWAEFEQRHLPLRWPPPNPAYTCFASNAPLMMLISLHVHGMGHGHSE